MCCFEGEDSEVNHALLAKRPLEVLVIEYTVLEPSSSGRENALVLTDVFKKDTQVFPTMDQKARTFAKVLMKIWFVRFGCLSVSTVIKVAHFRAH